MLTPQEAGRKAYEETNLNGGSYQECRNSYSSAYNKQTRGRKSCRFPEAAKAYEDAYKKAIDDNLIYLDALKKAKSAYNKVYKLLNRERLIESAKEYRNQNPEKIAEYRQQRKPQKLKWEKEKRLTDPVYALLCRRRCRRRLALGTLQSIKTNDKSFLRSFNCSKSYLIEWLEGMLPKGMTVAKALELRYHLDEIRPCSSFDLSNPEQESLCFDYRNCRLVEAAVNLKKHKSYKLDDETRWIGHMTSNNYQGDLFLIFKDGEDRVRLLLK